MEISPVLFLYTQLRGQASVVALYLSNVTAPYRFIIFGCFCLIHNFSLFFLGISQLVKVVENIVCFSLPSFFRLFSKETGLQMSPANHNPRNCRRGSPNILKFRRCLNVTSQILYATTEERNYIFGAQRTELIEILRGPSNFS